jgi:DNA (cytosine-5)-methyltransferase 1
VWAELWGQSMLAGRFVAVDLFCGCGGVSRGLRDAGFDVLAAVDSDPHAASVYRANHPATHLLDQDIQEVDVALLKKRLGLKAGWLDVLASCPPCQGFSAIRSRNGHVTVDDPRNDLALCTLTFVDAFRPKVVLLENVPGLGADARFGELVTGFRQRGYSCEHRVVDAADFGVPQRRRRLVLVASRVGVLPVAAPRVPRRTVRDAIGALPPAGRSGDPLHDVSERRSDSIKALIAAIPEDGGSRASLPPDLRLPCHREFAGFRDVYGRMSWDDVAPTVTGGCASPSKGRFLHPSENRAITLREAALLQGFPPDYDFRCVSGKHARAALIGNAVPPPMIKHQALQILSGLKKGGSR